MTSCDTNLTKQEHQEQAGVERTEQRPVFRPHVDIIEAPERIVLRVNMPGVNESGVDVTLEKNVLTLRGHVDATGFDGLELAYSEYGIGDYERTFRVTSEIDRDGIQAHMKDGVLRIELPKVKQAIQQKIPVNAG